MNGLANNARLASVLLKAVGAYDPNGADRKLPQGNHSVDGGTGILRAKIALTSACWGKGK